MSRGRPKGTKPPDKILQAFKLKQANPDITLKQLAQLTGTTPQNIHQSFRRHNIDWKHTQSYKQLEAEILAGYKDRLLQGITDDKINKASVKDIAISVGILDDKETQKRNKTAIKDMMSDVIERMSRQRKTVITIDTQNTVNIDNTIDKIDNNVINTNYVVEQ